MSILPNIQSKTELVSNLKKYASQVLIVAAQPIYGFLLLTACTHNTTYSEFLQETSPAAQSSSTTTTWHDGSKGGIYGIGEGWSIELSPAEYETITETIIIHDAPRVPLFTPAELEWVRDDTVEQSKAPILTTTLVTIPAEYETIEETVIVEPQKTEYFLTEATQGSNGEILKPRLVQHRFIPAETKQVERVVVKTPEHVIEKIEEVEQRKGYRQIVKTPAKLIEDTSPAKPKTYTGVVEKTPWQFTIKTPNGQIAHIFDDYNALKTFTDSLN